MSTPFDRDLAEAQRRLERARGRGQLFRLFTLGLFGNESGIQKARSALEQCTEDVRAYEELTARDAAADEGLREHASLPGARVSEHTLADAPTVTSTDYGPEWDVIRQGILERDNHECQEADGYCRGPLHVHHIVALSKRGTHESANLITLCEYHHSLRHPHMRNGTNGSIRS